jgi:hypothetical protein
MRRHALIPTDRLGIAVKLANVVNCDSGRCLAAQLPGSFFAAAAI